MDENPLNACEILNVKLSEIKQIVDTLHQYSTDNDIPDVFEGAQQILQNLLPEKSNFAISQEEQELKFDELVSKLERDFIAKHDKEVEKISQTIDTLQKSIIDDDQDIQKILKDGQLFQLAEVGKLTKFYNQIMQDNEKDFNSHKSTFTQREKEIYAKYEKDLAEKLGQVSAENTGKIEEITNKINTMQRELQSMIHQKHQQNTIKADLIAEEDRRMATEHEQISREYQTRKNTADDKIKRFTEELSKIEKSIANESQSATEKIQAMEQAMMNERNLVVEKHNKSLEELQNTFQSLSTELANKQSLIESEHSQAVTELKKAEREAKRKIEKEQNETEELITAARVEIEINYRPRIESMRKIIEDTENQRGKELEILRQQILASNEESEKSIAIACSHYQDESDRAKMAIKELKDELNSLKDEKKADLDELTKTLQIEVGKVLSEADETERKHNEEVNKIMQKFDEQQKYLTELHRVSVEAHDKMRADELARLKQEHEQRKNQLIFKLEQQAKIDRETLLASAIEAENQRHNNAIVNLKARIVELQSRIELLNMKFEGLYSVHGQRIEELQRDSTETSLKMENISETSSLASTRTPANSEQTPNKETSPEDEELQSAKALEEELNKRKEEEKKKGEAEIEEIKSYSMKLMNETQEFNRTKARILTEVDEINKNFAYIREDFEEKMFQIKTKFLAQKSTYDSKSRDMEIVSQSLQNKVADQVVKIEELTQIADRKEDEATKFEQSIPDQEEEFREQTKKSYTEDLEIAKSQPDDFEEKVRAVTDEMHEKMFEITKLIEAEKVNTEKISKMLMNERKEIFAQVEKVIRTEFKDRKKIFYKNYEKVIAKMDEDFNEKEKLHQKEMDDLEMQQRVQKAQFIDQHRKLMLDMEEEKERVLKESLALDKEIADLDTMECPQCIKKKASIRMLLQQRDALYSRLGVAAEKLEDSDKKVGSLFKDVKRAKVSRSMLDSLKASPKVLIPKPPMIRL